MYMGTKSDKIAAQDATPGWRVMRGQSIEVRETLVSNPLGKPPFLDPSLSEEKVQLPVRQRKGS